MAVSLVGLGSCQAGDELFCGSGGCAFSEAEWQALTSLAWTSDAKLTDESNLFVGDADAIDLGHRLYFDARLSGRATLVDMLGRPTQFARAAKGEPINVSCATCHTPSRAGADFTSMASEVSVGAGLYDVNGQQTVNAAAYALAYWNGRVDSLWAQAAAVLESKVSMNGSRLAIAWVVYDNYRDEFSRLFAQYDFPLTEAGRALLRTGLSTDGTCALQAGACPAAVCRLVPASGGQACVPRFPPEGKPGDGTCQWGSATEPFHDAFDCMDVADRSDITRMLVNVAKAIAAYEFTLVSKDSRFDRFVAQGPSSAELSAAARRGARLFVGKASCVSCHRTPLLSDQQFHNIGVPQVGVGVPTVADCPKGDPVCDCTPGPTFNNCLPFGAYDGLLKLAKDSYLYRRDKEWSDNPEDRSRARWYVNQPDGGFEPAASLIGAWRTPSLRDVALTAPYMHDGLYAQLIDVIDHYNRGGAESGFAGQKAPQLAPLALSPQEASDLVAFLEALDGAPLPAEVTQDPCRRAPRPSSCPKP